jgi:deoxyribodipyrimidine photo-lyase
MTVRTIWWIRRDLRLDDNPALLEAARADAMLPVYVHAPEEEGPWAPGGAQRWWLHRSLGSLASTLEAHGSRLVVLRGEAAKVLADLARSCGATTVVWSRRFEPAARAQESRVEGALEAAWVRWRSYLSNHLFDPEEIATQTGNPYQVYTPFARNVRARPAPARARSAPVALPRSDGAPRGVPIDELALDPTIDWAAGLRDAWSPGEAGARVNLDRFVSEAVADYPEGRDRPSTAGTSRLSPHLAFGEIGIRRVWHAVADSRPETSADKFRAELLWREFATHVLFHFGHTDLRPLRPEYARFPWRDDPAALEAWKRGRTGYPLVDAGMRELWTTGWMHNRVRMVVASFLVKHLLLPWQEGAKWFWETLVDADLANNSLGWQWAAGSGADAAPYFRIFNPTSQAAKFDADGAYIRRWVPELSALDPASAREPSAAAPLALAAKGLRLGEHYPAPVVVHAVARERALAALASVSAAKRGAS